MDYDFELEDNEPISKEAKEICELLEKYNNKKFKEFDTWDKSDEKLIQILKECLNQNKSYEQIYGKERCFKFNDY